MNGIQEVCWWLRSCMCACLKGAAVLVQECARHAVKVYTEDEELWRKVQILVTAHVCIRHNSTYSAQS